MKLSIISTMYRSSVYLKEFHERITASALKITTDYELILVNDGSPDDSCAVALELQQKDDRIVVVNLSRNFGHHAAIVAGLEHAVGDYIFLIDCDLEEQPEWLTLFTNELKTSGADVVYGIQKVRIASKINNFMGAMFWKTLNLLSNVDIPHNPMTVRLMTRKYVKALLDVGDRVLYLAGTFAWAGFRQHPIPLTKALGKQEKRSTYSLAKKILHVVDSISSFSIAPLILVFAIGVLIWIVSLVYAAVLVIQKIMYPDAILSGFTSLMFSLWFLSGTMLVSSGIIGIYVSKIFQEVKRRPLYIVKDVIRSSSGD